VTNNPSPAPLFVVAMFLTYKGFETPNELRLKLRHQKRCGEWLRYSEVQIVGTNEKASSYEEA